MKNIGYKLIEFIEKVFKINYCSIYARRFTYKKNLKGGNNGFEDKKLCPFCTNLENRIVKKYKHNLIINNKFPYPNTEKHLLVIPKRHIRSWKELNNEELVEIQNILSEYTDKEYIILGRQYTGENSKSQSSVFHLHIHLILRK